ncbi:5-formyltetrahydrofolate cyclo-ligase [Egibacter rhizosphaerae]|uniref:5-formyltetrahydrofolate cyclo-ligase n=1 Tax=Egibacter rhizosphaerae TaxID=1670831 RepID=A0A411YAR1_9ACTN|nr:5-formyltetrahydrofolate cyclo-ligase [Egibacter rhizosphaerae]QBI18285.1 5-formyltetrahydrofolate cyclo-ligase [Egibacter rhizosphaerae]
MSRDHDADAGGDPAVLGAKRALREEVWQALSDAGAARFPGARNRIPNFSGAEEAAQRLAALPEWDRADAVKANPDAPQRPVRARALEDGLVCYLAVPRLAGEKPFLRLDPDRLEVAPRDAASIKGGEAHGELVGVDEMEPVDLVVSGCVAVDRRGARLGKGGGFADLELALAVEAGVVTEDTVVATTVHPLQVVEADRIPLAEHDTTVDVIVTPTEVIRCPRERPRPAEIAWDALTDEKIAAIPLLRRLVGRA